MLLTLSHAQVPLPPAAKAASGDVLLVPASALAQRAHSQLLELTSPEVLATSLQLARSQAAEGELLRLSLPCTTEREACLLIAAMYSQQLAELLDSLPAVRLVELADVCHRFGCDVLAACEAALLRKAGKQGCWLTPASALAILSWAGSRGMAGVRRKAAEFAVTCVRELAVDNKAAEAGDDVALLLGSLQRRELQQC